MQRNVLIIIFAMFVGGFHIGLSAHTVNNTIDLTNCISQTSDDIPQWSELGMKNILVADNETSFSAPQSDSRVAGRNHSKNFSSRNHHADDGNRLTNSLSQLPSFTQPRAVSIPTRVIDYYIYFIYCLRL